MRFFPIFIIFLLFSCAPLPAAAAQKQVRSHTGIGVLILRPSIGESDAGGGKVVLYREPGIGRMKDVPLASLASLHQLRALHPGDHAVAVTGKKGEWYQIAYDDAGREGWLLRERSWSYFTWEQYLRGRIVRLLPGLKKGSYLFRRESGELSPAGETLTPKTLIKVIEVDGDRIQVFVELKAIGWVRWRDEDGRFMVSVE